MKPPVERLDLVDHDDATVVFCAKCGHSEFAHPDNGNRWCVLTVCDCNGFVAGATPERSAQNLPA